MEGLTPEQIQEYKEAFNLFDKVKKQATKQRI